MGNYSYYLMKKELAAAEAEEARLEEEKAQKIKAAREKEKQAKAARKTGELAGQAAEDNKAKAQAELGRIQSMSEAKRTEMIQRAEAEIAMAEAELKGLEYQMNDPAVQADPVKSQEIAEAYAAKEEEIVQRYEKWERLTEA